MAHFSVRFRCIALNLSVSNERKIGLELTLPSHRRLLPRRLLGLAVNENDFKGRVMGQRLQGASDPLGARLGKVFRIGEEILALMSPIRLYLAVLALPLSNEQLTDGRSQRPSVSASPTCGGSLGRSLRFFQ